MDYTLLALISWILISIFGGIVYGEKKNRKVDKILYAIYGCLVILISPVLGMIAALILSMAFFFGTDSITAGIIGNIGLLAIAISVISFGLRFFFSTDSEMYKFSTIALRYSIIVYLIAVPLSYLTVAM